MSIHFKEPMNTFNSVINKNNENSLKLGKKFLVGFLDFLLFFLLASVVFALYEGLVHSSIDYKDKINNVTRLEEELAEISSSSNLTRYVIDEQGNKYLESMESIARGYILNQVYTSLVKNDRDVSNHIFDNAYIINSENDVCLYYINSFRKDKNELFTNEHTLSLDHYKSFMYDNVSNEINFIYDNNEYPIINVSVASKIRDALINDNFQELKEYNLVKNAYQDYLELCINDFMKNYQPYIDIQEQYSNAYDDVYKIEILGLVISYTLSLLIYYLLIPMIIKDKSTVFMKLFRLKPLNDDGNAIDLINLICRFCSMFVVYLFTILILSFWMFDINTFVNVIFTEFLTYFNIFTLGTLSVLLVVCNMIFTLYNPKKKQTITEAISQIIVYEDKTLKKIQIGNKEFEVSN